MLCELWQWNTWRNDTYSALEATHQMLVNQCWRRLPLLIAKRSLWPAGTALAWGFLFAFYSKHSPKMYLLKQSAWSRQTDRQTDCSVIKMYPASKLTTLTNFVCVCSPWVLRVPVKLLFRWYMLHNYEVPVAIKGIAEVTLNTLKISLQKINWRCICKTCLWALWQLFNCSMNTENYEYLCFHLLS